MEGGFRFVHPRPAPRLDAHAERADRSGDPAVVSRHRAGDLRAAKVDGMDLVGQPEIGELEAIRAERIRLDHVGAGADVFAVHVGDEIGPGDVQLVEAAIEEDAARVEHRAHRAVADEHTLIERVEKGVGHFVAGTSRSSLSQMKSLLLYTASS